ncbi:MAG: hypothetical protein EA377_02315 [Phycisphaerales bacterium]|nr:MAG: hypothetical protein EA377_02315 [Phycisphaerales bacterium]
MARPAPDEYKDTLAETTVLSGQYEIVRKLGEGGMGEVHLAKDRYLNDRLVAIKTLPALRAASKRAIRQLQQEAAAMADLTHEHIVRFYHFGQHEGLPFLVMQYIDGRTLDDLLEEKVTLTEEELLDIARPIAGALDYAHSRGVIHKDIKPSNIFIDGEGKPYLADFGVARIAKDTISQVTGRDTTSGTLMYMSPEQCLGEHDLTTATDIYSFATVLYECLAGRPPFSSGPIRELILNEQPAAIDTCSNHINTTLQYGLVKTADARPESAGELVSQLQVSRRPSPVASPEKPADNSVNPVAARRTPVGKWAAVIVVIALLGLGMIYVVVSDSGRAPSTPETAGDQRSEMSLPSMTDEATSSRTGSREDSDVTQSRASIVEEQMEMVRDVRASPDARAQAIVRLYQHDAKRFDWKTLHDKISSDEVPRKVIDLGGGVEMAFIFIGPGTFTMGSPGNESGRFDNEGPQRQVRISRGFWLAETPTTQAQWQRVMGNNPSHFKGDLNRPVERISWNDSKDLANRFSERYGVSARLPTEAEWEYACRAGTRTRYSFGNNPDQLGDHAWYSGNSNRSTQPVRRKKPNPWGLYDMNGNVWEWVADWYGEYEAGVVTDPTGPRTGSLRVLRGGSWFGRPRYLRSANRNWNSPDYRLIYFGVRLALDSD